MKTIVLLSVLLVSGYDTRDTFWQQFKMAVANKNVDAIATLSRFPNGMSYGIASVKTKAGLRRRYRKVFNEQTNAATCCSKAKPEVDPDNAKDLNVACADEAGYEVVIYCFVRSREGRRFTGKDDR